MSNKIIDFQSTELFKKRQEKNIPVYSHRVSAGTLTSVTDDTVEKVINLNDIKLESLKGKKPENLSIVTISGNSMYPLLRDKQQVIIDHWLANTLSESELIGKIVIARVDNEHTIKRFNADRKYFYLIPENKDYGTIKVKKTEEGFRIIGVMVDILEGTY
jgi:SOS-response transcriptional repressor LexA